MNLNRWANDPWLKWRVISAGAILVLVIMVAIANGVGALSWLG